MLTLVKWFAVIAGISILAVLSLLFAMRFHDGPIAILSGGPFTSGTPETSPTDWSFVKDRQLIEFQTMDPPTSRTVWLAVHEGRLYLISGYMTTGYGKIWKQWPHYLLADDRVILRLDGKLYNQRLRRIRGGDVLAPVAAEFARKYQLAAGPEAVTSGYAWLYEVVTR